MTRGDNTSVSFQTLTRESTLVVGIGHSVIAAFRSGSLANHDVRYSDVVSDSSVFVLSQLSSSYEPASVTSTSRANAVSTILQV